MGHHTSRACVRQGRMRQRAAKRDLHNVARVAHAVLDGEVVPRRRCGHLHQPCAASAGVRVEMHHTVVLSEEPILLIPGIHRRADVSARASKLTRMGAGEGARMRV